MAAKKRQAHRQRTFFTAQVDFTHAGDLKVFVGRGAGSAVSKPIMKQRGYLEGSRMANAFNMLRPNDLIWPYVVNVYMKGKSPFPFDLLYWNSDSTRMPAANHAFYLRNCYLENKLAKGEMELAGVTLDLKKVKMPIFNLATQARITSPLPARCSSARKPSAGRSTTCWPGRDTSPASSTRPTSRNTSSGPAAR